MAAEILHDIYRSSQTFTYRGVPALRAWIGVVAANRMRKARRAHRGAQRSLAECGSPLDDQGRGDPALGMEQAEALGAAGRACWCLLLVCLASLERAAPPDREALRLHDAEGFTYREAAERLGVSSTEVARRVRRARRSAARHAALWLKATF